MRCAFIGHRDSFGIDIQIHTQIQQLINSGIIEFFSGGMGNFDKTCEKAVKNLGGILTFVPYNTLQIKEKDKLWYNNIVCPFGNKPYEKFDIPNRNKWLVDNCDMFFCYVYKPGGAKKSLDYALSKNKKIINLYPLK